MKTKKTPGLFRLDTLIAPHLILKSKRTIGFNEQPGLSKSHFLKSMTAIDSPAKMRGIDLPEKRSLPNAVPQANRKLESSANILELKSVTITMN